MISILIPIYNRKVITLVESIHDQCMSLNIEFEILCYDDLSAEKYRLQNRVLGQKIGVSYMDLSQNLGRAKIRNWLGKNARYENLLFMDCDSGVERKSFVKKYVEFINQADIIYGGTSYQKSPPRDGLKLHWKYGSKIEAMPLKARQKSVFEAFRSNNFMIKRSVFLKHLFDESIEGYGYEDSLFAAALSEQQFSLLHIDNPLIHRGLEENRVFIQKTDKAISNLLNLYQAGKLKTKLTNFYEKIEAWGLKTIFYRTYRLFETKINSNLLSKNPNLTYFQLYKLAKFIQLKSDMIGLSGKKNNV